MLSFPRRLAAIGLLLVFVWRAGANPTGLSVSFGSAVARQTGSQLNITVGNNAALNWQTFNIAAGEATIFHQPSATSIVWNRINDQNPSQIYGSLQANGVVVLLNSSGFYFGPNSFVSAAGLVVSTANCVPPQNGGGSWAFNGPPPLASIVNYGHLQVGNGGSAFLIADKVENHGDIIAPGGSIGLAAGQTVLLSERADGRGMSMEVTLPQGSVDNQGQLIADGGTVALNARVVNQNGLIQANSVRNQNGVIELVAEDDLTLGANSRLLAQGDDEAAGSAGGTVTLKSDNRFNDVAGSLIVTAGGVQGGNGGDVEVSAPNITSLNTAMDAGAQRGFTGGAFLLDPANIVLSTSGSSEPDSSGTVAYNSGAGTLTINVNTAFLNKNFSNIRLQATANITLAQGTVWNLSDSTGLTSGQVTLQAGGDIVFNSSSAIVDANNWSLNLLAGVSFPAGTVQSGKGNIYLNGGSGKTLDGAIQLAQGNVNLTAGNSVLVGGGYVRTVGGGSITVQALAGSVNTGTKAAGYVFQAAESVNDTMYVVSPDLGGISTAAGGDVSIVAGQNVTSYLPTASKPAGDAGCGAFGSAAGNVSITAGGSVAGHYVVANGTGTINAGNNAGTKSAQLALSLIRGGWKVTAGNNIVLQEVRNPNGVFNALEIKTAPSAHYFDYSAGAYVNLTAGNGVELYGASLARNTGSFETSLPIIYPGILNIIAGAGGVTLDNNVMLFPSAQGSLTLKTTGGGGLFGNKSGSLVELTMSDSADGQYISSKSFKGHATVPVHLDTPTPVTLDISGDMNNILFTANEAAQIKVGGNMNNSRFTGQNLRAGDVTSISVTGDIVNRNDFTSVPLASEPTLDLLNHAYSTSDFYTTLASLLHYDPVTKLLTFQGRMTSEQLDALTSLQVQVYEQDGITPLLDGQGNPVTAVVSILDVATATALFTASQDVPTSPGSGYFVGGGGKFNVSAHNLDLGTTYGIQSVGPQNNPALANYFTRGADINVTLTGNLDMFSTAICSLNGGNVYVNADGDINVGSSIFSGSDQIARGIFTTDQGNMAVYAGGDINVNGSRIAVYDLRLPDGTSPTPGGSVTVISRNGNIFAGGGAAGYVLVNAYEVDPVTHAVVVRSSTIPGSGILNTSYTQPGNILVSTPNGAINAGTGGIMQLLLNHPVTAETGLFDLTVDKAGLSEIFRLLFAHNSTAVHAKEHSLNGIVGDSRVVVYAGKELQQRENGISLVDAYGNPVINAGNLGDGTLYTVSADRNIEAAGSGIISAGDAKIDATGSVSGNFFALGNVSIDATKDVIANVLGLGTVNVKADGSITGKIIGIGGVSAVGGAIDADLESNNSISGNTSGEKGLAAGTAADNVASAASASSNADQTEAKAGDENGDDLKKKKQGIGLTRKVSRVTVILPPKNLSENPSPNTHL